jgi:hypothetical protein
MIALSVMSVVVGTVLRIRAFLLDLDPKFTPADLDPDSRNFHQ